MSWERCWFGKPKCEMRCTDNKPINCMEKNLHVVFNLLNQNFQMPIIQIYSPIIGGTTFQSFQAYN
uniref:Uncharacterized protein n=1 Tax=Romanomermis culicivorax TaxID=13658 RepID=A0A915KPJ4_ROMCU